MIDVFRFKAVRVERGAGLEAKFKDSDYEEKGAQIVSAQEVFTSDIILKVNTTAFSHSFCSFL